MVFTFCESCRRTPQLMVGGRKPSRRKLNEVSARIMPGMAIVMVTMR